MSSYFYANSSENYIQIKNVRKDATQILRQESNQTIVYTPCSNYREGFQQSYASAYFGDHYSNYLGKFHFLTGAGCARAGYRREAFHQIVVFSIALNMAVVRCDLD